MKETGEGYLREEERVGTINQTMGLFQSDNTVIIVIVIVIVIVIYPVS